MAKHKHSWPEAKKLCRLNQNDITMARSLGFRPDSLVRARPDPKQKWKLPVKQWIHELHFKRFGWVIGEKPLTPSPPPTPEEEREAARRFEEQLYWEDYWDRNSDEPTGKRQPNETQPRETGTPATELPMEDVFLDIDITDADVPF